MIGDKIRERRQQLNMSQEELALKVGYKSRSTIAKIEKNERDLPQTTATLIAKALGVPISYLMDWDDSSEMVFKDMNRKTEFRAYLKLLGWNVSLSGSGKEEFVGENDDGSPSYIESDVYTFSNGKTTFKLSAQEFEDLIEHIDNEIEYILDVMNKKTAR